MAQFLSTLVFVLSMLTGFLPSASAWQSRLGHTPYSLSRDYHAKAYNDNNEGDILTPPAGFGFAPLARLAVLIPSEDLGLQPQNCVPVEGQPCGLEVDALSAGTDVLFPGDPTLVGAGGTLWYSVDEFALGHPTAFFSPSVLSEGARAGVDDASADSFIAIGLPALPASPAAGQVGTIGTIDGNGGVSTSGALHPGVGLDEPNPDVAGLPDLGQNLDALDVGAGAGFPASGIYFSLDSAFLDPAEGVLNSGSAAGQGAGFVGGDVLFQATASATPPVIYAAAATLGLDQGGADEDDLDALILVENGTPGYQPSSDPNDWNTLGTDMLIFSVRRGSAIIGALDSFFGVAIEEGDLLTTPVAGGNGNPAIYIAAEVIGLATVRTHGEVRGDDLNAADFHDQACIDCNANMTDDSEDIATGTSQDVDMNGVPDECPAVWTKYCVANANSTGSPADISASGTASSSAGDLVLMSSPVPNQPGIFFHAANQIQTSFGNGFLCAGGGLSRGLVVMGSGNSASYAYDNSVPRRSLSAHIGSQRNFQHWFRDPMGGGAGHNTSNGLWFIVLP